MSHATSKLSTIIFILICSFENCSNEKSVTLGKEFPKSAPQALSFENVSILLHDMKMYADAVKALDQNLLQRINDRYTGLYFQLEKPPLILSAAADAAHGQVLLMLAPKDASSGSNFLLTFDGKLPVIDSETVELQFRTPAENGTVNCLLQIPNPAAYVNEYKAHEMVIRYTLYKKFLQSGTYDFDALTVPAYRTRGYPFIVFDLVKADLMDKTANLQCQCRLQS